MTALWRSSMHTAHDHLWFTQEFMLESNLVADASGGTPLRKPPPLHKTKTGGGPLIAAAGAVPSSRNWLAQRASRHCVRGPLRAGLAQGRPPTLCAPLPAGPRNESKQNPPRRFDTSQSQPVSARERTHALHCHRRRRFAAAPASSVINADTACCGLGPTGQRPPDTRAARKRGHRLGQVK